MEDRAWIKVLSSCSDKERHQPSHLSAFARCCYEAFLPAETRPGEAGKTEESPYIPDTLSREPSHPRRP